MPKYDYYCDENKQTIEVTHSMTIDLNTWGELCEVAGIDIKETRKEAPVRRIISKNVGIAFKGSGFYVTDSNTNKKAESKSA
ncbi:hypothetical protein DID75_00770 [Candidatus Marinamargulisbacteria bacterium SCGC AG-410-N11]|nr:hypothetical protein DID75_00770 [Candidatus Marinamargulisbacteria bacterium SCGC AG-410-N11]